jgi:hypothetical protein
MTSSFSPEARGPLRRVEEELSSRKEPRPDYGVGVRYHYRYRLSCGHVVERGQPRHAHCYCEECPR